MSIDNHAAWLGEAHFCHFRDFCGTKKQLFLRDKNNPILRDKKICEICEIFVRLKLYICVN